jgi:hypothetical protein
MINNSDSVETPAEKSRERSWLPFIIVLSLIIIAIVLWLVLGRDSGNKSNTNKSQAHPTSQQNGNTQIESLISYKLPTGWTDTDCISATETILIIPSGQLHPNCAVNAQDWFLKITMDTHNTATCNQIKVDNSQVTNHVCSSVPVNGQRFVKSSTTYNDKSTYGHNVKVSDYFIKANGGVVKLEYVDDLTNNNDDFQTGFDQLANSIQVKKP